MPPFSAGALTDRDLSGRDTSGRDGSSPPAEGKGKGGKGKKHSHSHTTSRIPLEGRSLFLFGPENRVRRKTYKMVYGR